MLVIKLDLSAAWGGNTGLTDLSPMQALFATTAMDLGAWLRVILVASSVLILVELERWFFANAQTRFEVWQIIQEAFLR